MSSNRAYLLDLANPTSTSSQARTSKTNAARKRPPTFQCFLCPSKFTRAFNLRSHLRTHTDERPFVCSVCGKAFSRQNDRKTHELLHNGEKKFVCRGTLDNGGSWGCGRRFAQAKNLGRHFRCEQGTVCIKPLVEQEARKVHQQQADGQTTPSARHEQPHRSYPDPAVPAPSNNGELPTTQSEDSSRPPYTYDVPRQWSSSMGATSDSFQSNTPSRPQNPSADYLLNFWRRPREAQPVQPQNLPPSTQEPTDNTGGTREIIDAQNASSARPEERSQIAPEPTHPATYIESSIFSIPTSIRDSRAPMPPINIKTLPLQTRVTLLEEIIKLKGIDLESELRAQVSPFPNR